MGFVSGIKYRELIVVVTLLLATVFSLFPLEVLAQTTSSSGSTSVSDPGSLEGTVCNVVSAMQGPIARGIAALAIIFLGFSLFLGKISWGIALALAIGIGAVFGANQIVSLVGGAGRSCSSS